MKTFKKFLTSIRRSEFIHSSATKRYEKHTKEVGFDDPRYSTLKSGEIKALQVYSAHSNDLNQSLVKNLPLSDFWKEHEPHLEEHLPKHDVYLISDGNHRVAKDKLKGKKFITAYVSRPKKESENFNRDKE